MPAQELMEAFKTAFQAMVLCDSRAGQAIAKSLRGPRGLLAQFETLKIDGNVFSNDTFLQTGRDESRYDDTIIDLKGRSRPAIFI